MTGRSHGFDDPPDLEPLLRGSPPPEAIAWVESITGGTVVSAVALRGGLSSAVHELEVDRGSGASVSVVLRRYVRRELLEEEPGIASREARTLRFVERIPVPTPLLLGLDRDGDASGSASVLMSRLGGTVAWPVSSGPESGWGDWLRRLAEIPPAIHSVPVPAPGVVPPFVPYSQRAYVPPAWSRQPHLWERAFEAFHDVLRGSPAGEATVFLQRDFHPGNVLWQDGRVSGVVDWQAACTGPPSIDIGHCRVNLFGYGIETADGFSRSWEELSGLVYEPIADVLSIVGVLDLLHEKSSRVERSSIEVALARALADVT